MPFFFKNWDAVRMYRAHCPVCGSCGPAAMTENGAAKLAEWWGWSEANGTCIVCTKALAEPVVGKPTAKKATKES